MLWYTKDNIPFVGYYLYAKTDVNGAVPLALVYFNFDGYIECPPKTSSVIGYISLKFEELLSIHQIDDFAEEARFFGPIRPWTHENEDEEI